MHTGAAWRSPSLDGAAERPDGLVTDVDDVAEQTLRSVSR